MDDEKIYTRFCKLPNIAQINGNILRIFKRKSCELVQSDISLTSYLFSLFVFLRTGRSTAPLYQINIHRLPCLKIIQKDSVTQLKERVKKKIVQPIGVFLL